VRFTLDPITLGYCRVICIEVCEQFDDFENENTKGACIELMEKVPNANCNRVLGEHRRAVHRKMYFKP